jgi:hypothetical protein
MNPTHQSFDDVSDLCERQLEATRGREIGLTFGAAIQALGRIAAHPDGANDADGQHLKNRADELLLNFARLFIVDCGWLRDKKLKPLQPTSMRNNMIYDPGEPGSP